MIPVTIKKKRKKRKEKSSETLDPKRGAESREFKKGSDAGIADTGQGMDEWCAKRKLTSKPRKGKDEEEEVIRPRTCLALLCFALLCLLCLGLETTG